MFFRLNNQRVGDPLLFVQHTPFGRITGIRFNGYVLSLGFRLLTEHLGTPLNYKVSKLTGTVPQLPGKIIIARKVPGMEAFRVP